MYTPKFLKKWKKVSDYGGEDLSDWYILSVQTRDSFLLDRTNFKDIKSFLNEQGIEIVGDLEDCITDNAVLLASFGHWACGWIESLMIHQDNEKALQIGDEIAERLGEYPVFDDESYSMAESELQWDYISQYVVKDWLNDKDIEYTDELVDGITSHILNNFNCEINGYDEVLLPKGLDIAPIVDRFQHLTQCSTCGDEIDNRHEVCSCQERLF